MEKELILIIGMHRSGTSMIGSILRELGYYVGEDPELFPPALDNLVGFAERKDIADINDKILKTYNSFVFNVDKFPNNDEWVETPQREIINLEIDKVLETLFEKNEKVLIKDPRMCLTFPIWEKRMKISNFPFTENKFVFIYRNPIDVAKSLFSRADIPDLQVGVKLWSQYNKHALQIIENKKDKTFLRYENFLEEPIKEGSRLVEILDDDPTIIYTQIYSVVEPSLQTNNSRKELVDLLSKNSEVSKTWNQLEKNYNSHLVKKPLDYEFRNSQDVIAPIIKMKSSQIDSILKESRNVISDLKAKIAKNNIEMSRLELQVELTQNHVENIESENALLKSNVRDLKNKLNSIRFLVKRIPMLIYRKITKKGREEKI